MRAAFIPPQTHIDLVGDRSITAFPEPRADLDDRAPLPSLDQGEGGLLTFLGSAVRATAVGRGHNEGLRKRDVHGRWPICQPKQAIVNRMPPVGLYSRRFGETRATTASSANTAASAARLEARWSKTHDRLTSVPKGNQQQRTGLISRGFI